MTSKTKTLEEIQGDIKLKQSEIEELKKELTASISTPITENWGPTYVKAVRTEVEILNDGKILLERTYIGGQGKEYDDTDNVSWPYAYLEIETLKGIILFLQSRGVL